MFVVDSHTGGEPTRVIIEGGPDLGSGSLEEMASRLALEHSAFFRSVTSEPRGQPAMVGALLVKPNSTECVTGVIFFNSQTVLGMCGHATIGLAVTLLRQGRIGLGSYKIETPVGIVEITLQDPNTVTLKSIESRLVHQALTVEAPELGFVTGHVAYGGNWFYIVDPSPIAVQPDNIPQLLGAGISLRNAINRANIEGENGESIDHVIFQARSPRAGIEARNFVLCPNDTYDRSPCGTGSSAWMACLAVEGRLLPGQEFVQESVIGSTYRLSFENGKNNGVIPYITGQAFVMAECRMIFSQCDPFRNGIRW